MSKNNSNAKTTTGANTMKNAYINGSSASTITATELKGGKNMIKQQLINALANGEISTEDIKGIIASAEGKPKARAKVAKSKQRAPRTKAYTEENVQEIQRMIDAGCTSLNIKEKFGISKSTIYRYLFKYHPKYKGVAQKYWEKLLLNDSNAVSQATVEVDEVSEEVAEVAITASEPEVSEPTEEVSNVYESEREESPKFLLDSQLVQRHDGRCYWEQLIKALKSKNLPFAVHSRKRMAVLAQYYGPAASALAKNILKDESIKTLDTKLHLEWAAASIGACVVTHSEQTAEACRNAGVDVLMVQDLIASANPTAEYIHELDPQDEEAAKWVKKLSLPVKINNNKRAIATLKDIEEYAEKHYGIKVTIKVTDCNKTERRTPTGAVRLQKGDFIFIEGDNLKVILKVCCETEKENCYEVYYSVPKNTSAVETA